MEGLSRRGELHVMCRRGFRPLVYQETSSPADAKGTAGKHPGPAPDNLYQTTLTTPMMLEDTTLASLPADALAALAPLRCQRGVTVTRVADRLWLQWQPGDLRILRLVLPLAGVELFLKRDGVWYRFGQYLPAWDVPPLDEGRPVEHVLFPAPFTAIPPDKTDLERVPLTLVPSPQPQPTSAVRCDLSALLHWAATIPSFRLFRLQAAFSGAHALVRGDRLPLVPGARRYWGNVLLVPLGYRLDPDLGEPILRQALLVEEELLVFDADGVERIPQAAFGPLSRGALRRALLESA